MQRMSTTPIRMFRMRVRPRCGWSTVSTGNDMNFIPMYPAERRVAELQSLQPRFIKSNGHQRVPSGSFNGRHRAEAPPRVLDALAYMRGLKSRTRAAARGHTKLQIRAADLANEPTRSAERLKTGQRT